MTKSAFGKRVLRFPDARLRFRFFFLFPALTFWLFSREQCYRALFTDPTNYTFQPHLKIILLQCFSVFSFQFSAVSKHTLNYIFSPLRVFQIFRLIRWEFFFSGHMMETCCLAYSNCIFKSQVIIHEQGWLNLNKMF